MFGDSDLGAFFDANGLADAVVQFNGTTAAGILDSYMDVFSAGSGPAGFERNTLSLKIAYNAFTPAPAPRNAIVVNGTNYTVKELPEQKDRAVLELYLKLA